MLNFFAATVRFFLRLFMGIHDQSCLSVLVLLGLTTVGERAAFNTVQICSHVRDRWIDGAIAGLIVVPRNPRVVFRACVHRRGASRVGFAHRCVIALVCAFRCKANNGSLNGCVELAISQAFAFFSMRFPIILRFSKTSPVL